MTTFFIFMACLSFSIAAQIDLVKVDKSKRRLYLIEQGQTIKTYRIALGKFPKGAKHQEGDQRTPEGEYVLDAVNLNSNFYKAFHISYPATKDIDYAKQHTLNPGGDIQIHGLKNGYNRPPEFIQSFDWTNGCIALTNEEMDELIRLVPIGTPIHIEW
ncbi:L,D-transpeptidase family protein [Vibrio mangrovi]|nr:L,D-transpeptidase family protein [Vibrio mangrovi]MDW6005127.1 L,D-transpeptidase family protein [Vibrio mangrovi]